MVYPIQCLDGIANRCSGQLYKGQRTHIGWTAREIVLPTMPGSRASGAIIKVAGITGRIRGRYDAAATTEENRRHWANADGLSARAANSPEVRRVLRNRARYETANNSYARGIVLTLANDLIGRGPRLQMLTPSAEANRRIEQEFSRWAKAAGLAEKLRTMRMDRAQDGEAFAVLTSNPRLPRPVKLDLRLIEADQVATPELAGPDSPSNAVDGIVFDSFGNPVEYHLLRSHPGDPCGGSLEYQRVPAAAMIHYFRADRPGQSRGVPEITPALPLFAQHGPADAMVYQSEFQRREIEPQLAPFGYQPATGHLIRGAFDLDEWEFHPRPHAKGEVFVVGRVARPSLCAAPSGSSSRSEP